MLSHEALSFQIWHIIIFFRMVGYFIFSFYAIMFERLYFGIFIIVFIY